MKSDTPSETDKGSNRRETPRERRTTAALLSAMVLGGGFATMALLIGAWNLVARYGGF